MEAPLKNYRMVLTLKLIIYFLIMDIVAVILLYSLNNFSLRGILWSLPLTTSFGFLILIVDILYEKDFFGDAMKKQAVTFKEVVEAKYILGWSNSKIFYTRYFREDFDREMKEYLVRKADITKL